MRKIIIPVSVALLLQCAVIPPEINLTGEKTALENQIIGTYDEIENESWITASRRSSLSVSQAEMQEQKQTVLQAVQNRQFNKDDIDELKKDKVAGENNQGFLTILPTPRYESEADYKQFVDFLVEQENADRQVIYQRAMILTMAEESPEQSKMQTMMAKIRADESAPGTMLQQRDGNWIEKPKESKKKEK